MDKYWRGWTAAFWLLVFMAGCTTGVSDKDETAFYKGKTITYIVATKAGGGYDVYARLIAEHMEKYLPGARIQIKNVDGAGHIIGANQLFAAKPDGLTIGTFNTGLIYAQLTERPGLRFNLREFSWIGKAASDPRILVIGAKSGVVDLAALRERRTPLMFASTGVGSAAYNETMLLRYALNIPAIVVSGYSGNEAQMAILRGEIQAILGSRSSQQAFIRNGGGHVVLEIGEGSANDVPAARDLVQSQRAAEIVAFIENLSSLARVTAAPPRVSGQRLAVLRQAYRRALSDPQLLAKAEKLGLPIVPATGGEVARRVDEALNQSQDYVKFITRVITQNPAD